MVKIVNSVKAKVYSLLNLGPKSVINLSDSYKPLTLKRKNKVIELNDEVSLVGRSNQKYPVDYSKSKITEHCSDFYLASLKNCRYFHTYGELDIISHETNIIPFLTILPDYMRLGPNYLDKVLSIIKYPKSTKIKGKSLFLTTMGAGEVYGEWVIFLLPKIGFLKEFGLDFSEFDHIILNEPKSQWQKDFIDLLGIPKEKIIGTNNNSSLSFEELYIPHGPGHSLKGFEFLQSIPKGVYKRNNKRYFLSRKRDTHMRVLNEEKLHNLFSKHEIEIIYIQDYTVKEQIEIFQESELIISAQGSGLTNIVFSNSQTKFIELYAESNMNSTFQCYGYYNQNVFGTLICSDVHSGFGNKCDITVEESYLEALIEEVLRA